MSLMIISHGTPSVCAYLAWNEIYRLHERFWPRTNPWITSVETYHRRKNFYHSNNLISHEFYIISNHYVSVHNSRLPEELAREHHSLHHQLFNARYAENPHICDSVYLMTKCVCVNCVHIISSKIHVTNRIQGCQTFEEILFASTLSSFRHYE